MLITEVKFLCVMNNSSGRNRVLRAYCSFTAAVFLVRCYNVALGFLLQLSKAGYNNCPRKLKRLVFLAQDLTAINVNKTGHRKKILSESAKLEETTEFPAQKPVS